MKYKAYVILAILVTFTRILMANPSYTDIDKTTMSNTPKNIITLEHRYTEMLLSLGIVPIGATDILSYKNYDGVYSDKLNFTKDVGQRSLPSIVSIATLTPDLIIGANFRNIQAYKILNKIAPTFLFDYIDVPKTDSSSLHAMLIEFKTIAQILDKSSMAKSIIAELEVKINADKEKITLLKENHTLINDRIAIAQFLPGSSKIRLFATDSVSMELMTKLGLKPAWNVSSGYSGMGYLTVSISTLQSLGKFNFFYFNERSDDSQLKKILSSKMWNSLDFVKAGLVYELNQDTWPWGGPISLERLMQQIVNNLDQGKDNDNKQKS